MNGVINPIWGTINDNSAHRQNIQFDVAVTVADKNNGSAQAGVKGSIKIVEFREPLKTRRIATVSVGLSAFC
ncbi:hypothetical protein [Thiothrix winogradskyi]|uniref:C2 domain-containing protein n=1 Tax=Thiothrix winogradskyi TaxID=96472 RepID=A0ABY3SVY6_9GAMM|nr:hypothetical protein [Thiothrix winogradskyi]UJS23575.1 hypothetical protein L2Y54_16760 [Thiothrix winogradskyi]